MTPHPVKDIDLERKEELIMAKQLRAARVTILPKKINSSYVERKEPPKPLPPAPKIQPKSVAKAQNPIALRYWNQCMALSTQVEVQAPTQDENISNPGFDPSHPPWALSDTHLPPTLSDTRVNGQIQGKQTGKITVPNINKQIKYDNISKRTDWAKILAEEEEHLEKHKKFKMNQSQRLQIETPAFLRKQRSVSSVNSNHNNGTNSENGNAPHKKVKHLQNKNETFFEHIRRIQNIEDENQQTQNPNESKDSSCGHTIPQKFKTFQKSMEGTKKEETKNGVGVTNENNLSIDNSQAKEKHKDEICYQTSNKNISVVKDKPISNKGNSERKKQNDVECKILDPETLSYDEKSQPCSCQHSLTKLQSTDSVRDMDQHVNKITRDLSETQKTEVGMLCFDKLSPDVKDDLLGRHLSTIHVSALTKLLSLIKEEVLSESLLNILPKLSNSQHLSVSEQSLHKKDAVINSEGKQRKYVEGASENDEIDASEIEFTSEMDKICKDDMISNEHSSSDSNTTCNKVVNPTGTNTKLEKTNFENPSSPKKFASGVFDSNLKKHDHQIPTEDIPCEKTSNTTELESNVDGLLNLEQVDERRITSNSSFEENAMEENFVIDSSSSEKDDHLCESDENDYAVKDNMEGDQTNDLDVESGNIGNKCYEDDTSKDMSINEACENEDEYFHGNEEEAGEDNVCDTNKTTDENSSEQKGAESEDESWEYEWEEEEEYEYEYYEEEDDEYKVQKFDGSFSVSLKT